MKKFFRTIHLYLGLAAGLVIMTCCFTGAVLVFEKELQEAFHHDRYFVPALGGRVPLEQLVTNVKQQYPKARVASVKVYADRNRTVEIGVSLPGPGSNATEKSTTGAAANSNGPRSTGIVVRGAQDTTHAATPSKGVQPPTGGGRPTHTVFMNPYSGAAIELYSYRETFFYTMFSLHRWLLGSDSSIGKTITGVSTLIFIVILITGIVLWWPRNKAILRQRLRFKKGASFKRLNHDWHVVLGFYSAIFLFIFAFTALAWSFKWFNDGIYKVTGTSQKPAAPARSKYAAGRDVITYDVALAAVVGVAPDAIYYTLRPPGDDTASLAVTVLPKGVHESASDNYYVDQYAGVVVGQLKFTEKNLGQRVRSSFKPVHVGSIWGLPSKIIAFIFCLLGATFPVTGVIMWINRLKKNKRSAARAPLKVAEVV